MLRNLIPIVAAVLLFTGCESESSRTKTSLHATLAKAQQPKLTPIIVPLTDSAKLTKHLDRLPKAVFPLETSEGNDAPNINLTDLKNKRLFKLMYKRIPRSIGGAVIDMSDQVDTTFNLCDTNYRANWLLVAKTPKFFVVEVNTNYLLLVTMNYHLNLIDAIHVAASDPSSNDNFQAELTSTIYKNLRIALHYSYYIRTDEERHFDTEHEDDVWRIDKTL